MDELLGDPDLDDGQVRALQETIRGSGAVDEVERMIADHVDQALAALDGAPLTEDAREALSRLADSISVRTA